jgi:hypothetical protein
MSPTNKECLLDMFHNRKNMVHQRTHLKAWVETIQLKVMSTWETNIMTKQTWVATKALA